MEIIKNRIKKLLTLSKSPNENEAAKAIYMANKLAEKYRIPYVEFDEVNPQGAYGKTKLEGERMVSQFADKFFIVRIAWAFGENGNNFVKTMLRLAQDHEEVGVVYDQVGSPTYSVDLARLLADIIQTDKYGTYHGTNEGYCSWAEFAAEIMKQADLKCEIVPVTTEEYYTPNRIFQ